MTLRRPSQQKLLQAVKAELGLDWDTLALRAGIKPRALKSYRLPDASTGFRAMPELARAAVEDLRRTGTAEAKFDQHAFLRSAMTTLKLSWDELADAAGINRFTFQNYLRSEGTKSYRGLPPLARSAIDRLVRDRRARRTKSNA